MSDSTQARREPRAAMPGAMLIAGLIAIAISALMIGFGWTLRGTEAEVGGLTLVAAGGIGVALTALLVALASVLNRGPAGAAVGAGSQPITELARAIDHLAEQNSLSDEACRVLNRRRDRELLRRAIEEDIAAEDWDAAMVLVKELAERFGYRAEAEEFRQRIEHSRYETVQRKVNAALASMESMIEQRRWDQALAEAARIGRLYPESPRVEGLRHRVEEARHVYKADLERRFLVAAEEDRIDEAMNLLRELDAYLTEHEAEPFRELARGVIGKARNNLGAQFKLAVHDHRWARAVEIGQRIIEEFPNSRMAQEVRGVMESIRARALENIAEVR
jgi:tetratricopeptide (TPR) repeat protein